ncbi:hypothetical protein D5R40_30340 [Okeania hirsuta]|uniref:Uncharacterized protein n=2 Tax=Okeania TaxID=1458928 RepID=A0A3N6R0X8_9CYAN|nr:MULTISPECIES: hypothetical protein [Okeania]NET75703.1 hypothetical protein [Okeania sp. SIO1F9]RQH23963.1 hypothetical protein D5R40_30340 [Okeania hirsuta]
MNKKQPSSLWKSMTNKASTVRENLGKKVSKAGQSISEKASETAKTKASEIEEIISNKTSDVGKYFRETVKESAFGKQQTNSELSPEIENDLEQEEIYHIFVAYQVASQGGTQKVTLKSGKSYNVRIRPNSTEGSTLRLKKCGLQGNDAFLVLHTFYNPEFNLDRRMNNLIIHSSIYERSKTRCLEAYNRINVGLYVYDLAALNLLDFIVNSSNIDSLIGLRYTIASENSRWIGIDKSLEEVLEFTNLSETEKCKIKSIYQYIKAADPLPKLDDFQQLNAMILNSAIASELKDKYLLASATSTGLRIDMLIVDLIYSSSEINDNQRRKYLSLYQQIKEGVKVKDNFISESLDSIIIQAEIPRICKIVYQLLRERYFEIELELEKLDREELYSVFSKFKKVEQFIKQAENPTKITNSFGNIAIQKGMLIEEADDAVVSGGVGVLAGVKVLKGGEALIGAVGLVAIASTLEMSTQEKIKLGITEEGNFYGGVAYSGIMNAINQVSWVIGDGGERKLEQKLDIFGMLKGSQDKKQILQELETKLYSSNP